MKTVTFSKASALLVVLCSLTDAFSAGFAGRLDPSFTPGAGFRGGDETSVYAVVPLADGRILVGGDFDTYNGVVRPDLVRLYEDGSLDPTIHLPGGVNAGDEPAIWSAGFQPDGNIIVSGHFSTISGVARLPPVRLHPDGTLDTAWFPGLRRLTGGALRSIVLPDGRILAWDFLGIERLNADGSADTNFNVALDGGFFLNGVSRQADGRILLALDTFPPSTGATGPRLVRLHANGAIDTGFLTGQFEGGPLGAEEMPDGRILVFGKFRSIEGHARRGLALLHSDGRLDISAQFEGERDYAWQARALSDGSVVAHSVREALFPNGFDVTLFSEPRNHKKLKERPWRIEFSVSPNAYVLGIAEDAAGRVLIVGEFWAIDGASAPGIARLLRK